jgi:hypothetical protein
MSSSHREQASHQPGIAHSLHFIFVHHERPLDIYVFARAPVGMDGFESFRDRDVADNDFDATISRETIMGRMCVCQILWVALSESLSYVEDTADRASGLRPIFVRK